MFYHLKNSLRLLKIAVILARCDAVFLLEKIGIKPRILSLFKIFTLGANKSLRSGEKMVAAFTRLGPVFIKLGQSLSTRSDIFGEQITADLSVLQDKSPAFPASIARQIIEQEFQKKTSEIFSEFDDSPVAAASVAQVHFAKDLAGKKVAVKILRPDIEKQFARDFEFLHWLAKIAAKRPNPRLKPLAAVAEFEKTVKLEMDLRMEAAAASEIAENFARDADMHLKIPAINWQLTSRKILVMERVCGININDLQGIKNAGLDADEILRRAANIVFKMVLIDGLFHADMHPGNMFITTDGDIALVDFGIVGRIDSPTRKFLAEMLYGFLKRDYALVSRVHFEIGFVPPTESEILFTQACRSIGEPIMGLPQSEISVAKLLAQLFKISDDFKMELQPQMLLLQKTMMLTEGIGRKLNPTINMWQLAEPMIEKWARQNMGVRAKILDNFSGLHEFGYKLSGYLDAIKTFASVVTPEGIKLHPETIKKFKNGK